MRIKYFIIAAALAGCYVEGDAHVAAPVPVATVEIDEAPPQPQYEEVVVRPGYVWIQGRWVHDGGRYVWRKGYYEHERHGYHWVQGHWERGRRGHVWIEGHWSR